jgi:hypothetical protein
MPTGNEWNTIRIESGIRYTISYSISFTYLLPEKPYSTDCLNYHIQTGYLSQKDCFRRCLLKVIVNECDSIPKDTNLFKWKIKSLIDKHLENNCSKNIELRNRCLFFCRKMGCVIHYYEPYVIVSTPKNGNESSTVMISILREPKKIYRYLPKIETIEFLWYFASILSLWFGFSFESVYVWVDKLRFCFENKFNPKMITLNDRIHAEKKVFAKRNFRRFWRI